MPLSNVKGKCSMHVGKKYSRQHNNREYDKSKWNKDGHIDKDRMYLNEILVDKNLQDFMHEEFIDSILEFNEKNLSKHSDRVIDLSDYKAYCNSEISLERKEELMKKISASYYEQQKNKAQEIIIQMGDHENFLDMVNEVGEAKANELHKNYLMNAYEKFKEENPNFKIFGAYIHMDEIKEGMPHLHLDFLPVANSSRGLSHKVSLEGALKKSTLKEKGFNRTKEDKYAETPYKQWLVCQRLSVENQAKKYIQVIPSEPCVTKHQQTYEYKVKEQNKNAIQKITGAFKVSKTIATADAVIANADDIKQVATLEAKDIINKAKTDMLKSKRLSDEVKKEKDEAVRMQEIVKRNDKKVCKKIAKLDVIIEYEVQKRLAPQNYFQRIQDENERYKNRQFKQQEEQQQLFEKIKNKSVHKKEQKGR